MAEDAEQLYDRGDPISLGGGWRQSQDAPNQYYSPDGRIYREDRYSLGSRQALSGGVQVNGKILYPAEQLDIFPGVSLGEFAMLAGGAVAPMFLGMSGMIPAGGVGPEFADFFGQAAGGAGGFGGAGTGAFDMGQFLPSDVGLGGNASWGVNARDSMGFFDDFFGNDFGDGGAMDMFGSGDIFNQPWVDTPGGAMDMFGSTNSPSGTGLGGTVFDAYPTLTGGESLWETIKKFVSPPGGGSGDGGGASDLSRLLFGNRGLSNLFGDRGLLGTGLAMAPGIAAINYAKNQDPFDTSRLESVYSSIDPNALALPYDMATARGRGQLTSSLTDRGVMGSSFANQDMSSYDTLRDLGRSNLLTSGAGQQASVANMIMQAQVKERELKNNLYGRALLALSGGISPRTGIADLLGGA